MMPQSDVQASILDHVKSGYELLWDHKKDLEKKATSILTSTGMIATLIFGINSFLKDPNITYLLIIAMATSVFTILMSIFSLRISNYYFIVAHEPKHGHDLDKIISEYYTGGDIITNARIMNYVQGIKENTGKNLAKAKIVSISTWSFFATVLILSVVLISYAAGIKL